METTNVGSIIYNTNKNKCLIQRHYDIGEAVNISFEQKVLGDILRISRVLYTSKDSRFPSGGIELSWVNDSMVNIDNSIVNIYTTKIIRK